MDNYDENLLLSLPSALAMTNKPLDNNNNMIQITTQNYMDKYKDLEAILAEERKNNDEVKKFYKALKNDHTRLKTESLDLKSQLTNLIEENKIMQEKYKAMLDKMQQELRRKQIIIEELKNRELDEVKLDRIKENLTQQIEAPYKEIVKQFESELEKLQQECNRIKFENNTLKSSSEHSKTEQNSLFDQLKLKHEVELNALRKDRDSLRLKLQETNHAELNRVKEVIRENNQLKIKVKSLIEENEEIREKLEHSELHNNLLVRNQSKSLSDYETKISVLESEKESLKQQADNSYKDSVNLNETLANTVRKLHDVERENTSIKLRFDELQYNCKKDMANLKLDMVKERGEFNRVKENLNNQLEDMKLKVEIANNSIELQKKTLEEKDRELAKTKNTINEENWTKINELTNEKIELESKIQMLTKDFEFKLNLLQIEKDKSDDKLKAFDIQREEIIKENNQLRNMFNDTDNIKLELEKEQEKNRELYKKCHKYETELASNTSLEQELTEMNMKLKSELSFTTNEIKKFKNQINKLKEDFENRISEMRTQKLAEINEYKYKYEEINAKLTRSNTKLAEVRKFHDQKKKQYQSYAKKIKSKAEILNAKINEFKIKEKNLTKHTVSIEAYNKLKTHLNTLLKKHQAFRGMILNNNPSLSPNLKNEEFEMFGTNLTIDFNANTIMNSSSNRSNRIDTFLNENPKSDSMHSKFGELTNRLDQLTSIQNEQIRSMSDSRSKISAKENNDAIASKRITKSPSLSPVRSVKSKVLQNEKSFDHDKLSVKSNNKSPVRQLEIKKLSFSSSSSSSSASSSTSNLNESVSKEFDNSGKKMNKSKSESKLKSDSDDNNTVSRSPRKQTDKASKSFVNEKNDYDDDDFEDSFKNKSSSTSS